MSPTPGRPERPKISEKPPWRRSPRAAAEIDHGSFDSLSEPARGSGVALRCRATAAAAARTTPRRPERPKISEKPPWRRSSVSPDAADHGTPRTTHEPREAALRRSPRAAAEIDHGSFDSLSEPARGSGAAAPVSSDHRRRRSNVSPYVADPGTPRATQELREAAPAPFERQPLCRRPRNAPSDPRSPRSRPGAVRRAPLPRSTTGPSTRSPSPLGAAAPRLRCRATTAAAVRTSAQMSPTPERPERPKISEKPPRRRSSVSPDAADHGTPRATHDLREAALAPFAARRCRDRPRAVRLALRARSGQRRRAPVSSDRRRRSNVSPDVADPGTPRATQDLREAAPAPFAAHLRGRSVD
jgi:hypothetical protein